MITSPCPFSFGVDLWYSGQDEEEDDSWNLFAPTSEVTEARVLVPEIAMSNTNTAD